MNKSEISDPGPRPSQEERKPSRRSERVRSARPEGGVDVDRWREVGRNLSTQVEEQIEKRPYMVIGAAAGLWASWPAASSDRASGRCCSRWAWAMSRRT